MKRTFSVFFTVVFSLMLTVSVNSQSPSREDLQKEIEAKRTELATLEEQFLSPSESDRASYASFLTQPDTGLIRLLPREIYDSEVNKRNRKTITMRGGVAYYSFARGTHEYGYGSDIELDQDYLSVGFAGLDYGMLLNLGHASVEEITLDYPAVRTLSDYKPPAIEPEIRKEQRRFGYGTELNGFNYKSRVPLALNATYLLRSISYSRSDTLVVFRVVRKDSDGSVITLWKSLKVFPAPNLARNKENEGTQSVIR